MTILNLLLTLCVCAYVLITQPMARTVRPLAWASALCLIGSLYLYGFDLPSGSAGLATVAAALVLAGLAGALRGLRVQLRRSPDGHFTRTGTAATSSLAIGSVTGLAVADLVAGSHGVDTGSGLALTLLGMAVLTGVQQPVMWRRIRTLTLAHA